MMLIFESFSLDITRNYYHLWCVKVLFSFAKSTPIHAPTVYDTMPNLRTSFAAITFDDLIFTQGRIIGSCPTASSLPIFYFESSFNILTHIFRSTWSTRERTLFVHFLYAAQRWLHLRFITWFCRPIFKNKFTFGIPTTTWWLQWRFVGRWWGWCHWRAEWRHSSGYIWWRRGGSFSWWAWWNWRVVLCQIRWVMSFYNFP